VTWRIVEVTSPDHVLVAFERDGREALLNIRVARDIEAALAPPAAIEEPSTGGPRPAGVFYRFKAGEKLAWHSHAAATLHDVRVLSGHVLLRKASGDVELGPGEVGSIGVDERHEVEALETAETLHVLTG
jgi:quercetin dioxygenase-like cupin family protein